MRRWLFNLAASLSLLLFICVLVLWVRSQFVSDQLEWSYDRYLADRSAASNQVDLTTDQRRLWLLVMSGHVEPFNGQLVWGYYMRADQSGGRPQLRFHHESYNEMDAMLFGKFDPDSGTAGLGPLRWQSSKNIKAKDGHDSRMLRIGISHWALALLLLIPPMLALNRIRKSRRFRRLGLCPACGYDLRATTDCCPECGAIAHHRNT